MFSTPNQLTRLRADGGRPAMLTIAVIARKGGAGKTTLALHLAVEAAKHGPVAIIDTDPQASAALWADGRLAVQPSVLTCPAARLSHTLEQARQNGARVAFVDTAPSVETAALTAAKAADFCLIVSRPGILDLQSIAVNLQIARLAGRPVALVMNAAPARDGQAAAAGEGAGRDHGVELCPVIIHQRAVFSHALAHGLSAQEFEPASKAAAEISALWEWLAQRTGFASTPPLRLSA
jgi:chromosome partitioning protein